jgi:hypothetical protein
VILAIFSRQKSEREREKKKKKKKKKAKTRQIRILDFSIEQAKNIKG